MLKICLLVIVTSVRFCFLYELRCPGQSHWYARSKAYCNDPRRYFCLQGSDGYIEGCDKAIPERPGWKIVWRGNYDSRNCTPTRFQPFPFWTNISSDCIYQKSNCSGEGLVVHNSEELTSDIQCRCDYLSGYAFLTTPSKTCYCTPSKEDCTCYKKRCGHLNDTLASDYTCAGEVSKSLLKCPSINKSKDNTDNIIQLNISNVVFSKQVDSKREGLRFIPLCITIVFIALLPCLVDSIVDKVESRKEKQIQSIRETTDSVKEVHKYIRILIIGEKGVGKTCLLRRLLKEKIDDVESTDGIDIEIAKCTIREKDGKWKIHAANEKEKMIIDRLKRTLSEGGQNSSQKEATRIHKKTDKIEIKDNIRSYEKNPPTVESDFIENRKSQESGFSDPHEEPVNVGETYKSEKTNLHRETKTNHEEIKSAEEDSPSFFDIDEIAQDLDRLFESVHKYDLPKERYIECGLWDFAGEREYYATHQVFLSSNCIVLLVADLGKGIKTNTNEESERNFDSIGEYIDFWIDNIHLYTTETTETTEITANPPIIIVGTGTDKIEAQELGKTIRNFKQNVLDVMKEKESVKHISSYHFISNKTSPDKELEILRQKIFRVAQNMKSLEMSIPLAWIKLERVIYKLRRTHVNVLKLTEVLVLAERFCSMKDKEDVIRFLKFEHKIRKIIFFEDIPDFIITDPKWLVDVFKCLVTDKIPTNITTSEPWIDLLNTGKINTDLLELLLGQVPELKYILKILEKFDIIINPEKLESTSVSSYYVPFLIRNNMSLKEIKNIFHLRDVTPWLIFEFNFLPLAFFNHIFDGIMRMYPLCKEPETKRAALYHGVGVFELKANTQRLMLCFSKNTVALQIHSVEENVTQVCSVLKKNIKTIVKMVQDRYDVRLKYTVKAKCNDGKYFMEAGRVTREDIRSQDEQYFCEEHKVLHHSANLRNLWLENEITDEDSITVPQVQQADQPREPTTTNESSQSEIAYEFLAKFPLKKTRIYDILSYADGEVLIADGGKEGQNGRLLLCKLHVQTKLEYPLNNIITMMSLPGKPYCLAVINESTTIVTLPHKGKILKVDIRSNTIQKEIYFDQFCSGVLYIPDQLQNQLLIFTETTLEFIDMNGTILKTRKLPGFVSDNIYAGNNCIYCTEHNRLLSIDFEANELKTFVGVKNTVEPRGVTMDDEGFLLVAYDATHNVCRISPDLKTGQIIITGLEDKQWSPFICFDKASKSIVIGRKDTVYIYKRK